MKLSKRTFIQGLAASAAVAGARGTLAATSREKSRATSGKRDYRRISCEEAFSTPEIVAELSRLAGGKPSMKSGPIAGPFMPNLLDVGAGRIAGMDRDGVDVQILSLTSPGVQTFDPATSVSMARAVNDRMADAIRAYPTRFAGLATVATPAPAEAAREIQRAVHELKLNGAIINSHTSGEYLDNEKYWPILEAIEALDIPLYIHPRDPSPGLEVPLAIPGFAVGWGYAVETGTHALRLIGAGVFERFPKLRIVLGHLGETLPFLLDRLDNRYQWQMNLFGQKGLPKLPSQYFRDNFVVTTSGMNYAAPVRAAISALGPDKVIFAADYPMEVQKDAVDEMEAIELTATERRKIFDSNARRVFGLKAPL